MGRVKVRERGSGKEAALNSPSRYPQKRANDGGVGAEDNHEKEQRGMRWVHVEWQYAPTRADAPGTRRHAQGVGAKGWPVRRAY